MELPVTPYESVENKSYDDVTINLTPDIFHSTRYNPTKTVFNFHHCNFTKLTINNFIEIGFKDISIHFMYCNITSLEIFSILSKNISVVLYSCIISGNIVSDNLKSVTINTCICISLFLQNQQNVLFSFSVNNILVREWIKMLRFTDLNSLEELIALKQSVYINNVLRGNFTFPHSSKDPVGFFYDKYEMSRQPNLRYSLSNIQKNRLAINLHINNFQNQEESSIKINNYILDSLSLTGPTAGAFLIENSKINNLYIRDFSSTKETLLYNITPYSINSKLEVHRSNMDNSWFDNIDFNSYSILSFHRTRFAKASFTSCNFPVDSLSFQKFKTLENIHYPDEKSINYYKDQYETFLQLKLSLESTGNFFEAQKLSAISKDALRKIDTLPPSDKFILWLNNLSNTHGLSIIRPFLGLIIFSVIFYIAYLVSIDRIFYLDQNLDSTLLGHYFTFLDITHKSNFLISESEQTFWSLAIDFFNKIVVGFFIFQFISAFRKYVTR